MPDAHGRELRVQSSELFVVGCTSTNQMGMPEQRIGAAGHHQSEAKRRPRTQKREKRVREAESGRPKEAGKRKKRQKALPRRQPGRNSGSHGRPFASLVLLLLSLSVVDPLVCRATSRNLHPLLPYWPSCRPYGPVFSRDGERRRGERGLMEKDVWVSWGEEAARLDVASGRPQTDKKGGDLLG